MPTFIHRLIALLTVAALVADPCLAAGGLALHAAAPSALSCSAVSEQTCASGEIWFLKSLDVTAKLRRMFPPLRTSVLAGGLAVQAFGQQVPPPISIPPQAQLSPERAADLFEGMIALAEKFLPGFERVIDEFEKGRVEINFQVVDKVTVTDPSQPKDHPVNSKTRVGYHLDSRGRRRGMIFDISLEAATARQMVPILAATFHELGIMTAYVNKIDFLLGSPKADLATDEVQVDAYTRELAGLNSIISPSLTPNNADYRRELTRPGGILETDTKELQYWKARLAQRQRNKPAPPPPGKNKMNFRFSDPRLNGRPPTPADQAA